MESHEHHDHHHGHAGHDLGMTGGVAVADSIVRDPVCGMTVDPHAGKPSAEHASVPDAAGVLYPVFGVLLSPMLAAAAMSLSSVSVIANALRLRTTKL